MAMLCLSISASAYDFEVDGFYYDVNLEKMTVTLVAGENKQTGEIIIPASVSYKGREFSVTSINGAFRGNTKLTGVELPTSVVSLEKNAFNGCSSLKSISGLDNITELGVSCFAGCVALPSIDLPEGLKKIESQAFYGCAGLEQLSIPETVYSIGNAAFSNCTSLCTIVLPKGIESLSSNLFEGCISLDDITIPSNVSAIESGAFSGCNSLTSITIPSNVSTIGNNTFNGCSKLSNVIFSDGASVLEIGTQGSEYPLFADCPLTSVYMGRNLTYPSPSKFYGIRPYYSPFEGAPLQDVKFGEKVTYLYYYLFKNCNQLTSISIPNNINTIYYGVFFGCQSISKLIVEDGTTPLYFYTGHLNPLAIGIVFMNDCPLDDIYIGRNITGEEDNSRDGYSVLYHQTSLKHITIGDFVTDISCLLYDSEGKTTKTLSRYTKLESLKVGQRLSFVPDLSDNSKLNSLSLTSILPQIASGFSNSQYMDLNPNIPIGTQDEYSKAPIWKNFWDFNEQADLLTLFEIDGLWYHVLTENTVEVVSNNNPYVGDIIIPAKVVYQSSQFDVVSIGDVFSENPNISSIILPNTIQNLSKGCFQDCVKLSSVTLGNGILSIPDECFKNCLRLSIVVLPDKLETIGKNAFYGCQSLNSISFPDCLKRLETGAFINCGGLSEISLPHHIDYMGTSVFMGCSNLQLVNWSRNMYSINDYTFKDCTSLNNINSLNNIIKIGQEAFRNCSSLQSINLGEEILTIGNFAFADSGIKDFVVAKSVESIESDAFSNCASLTILTFVESERPIVLGYNSNLHLASSITPFPNPSDVDESRTGFKNGYYDGLFYGLPIEHLVINRDIELPKYYERITGNSTSRYSTVYNDIVYYPPFYGLTNLKYVEIGENVSAICKNQIEAVANAVPTTMEFTNFGKCDNIEVVVSNNPIAPIGGGFSQTVYEQASLFLPNGGFDSYKKDDYWKNFVHLNDISFIPVESISFESDEVTIDVNESKKLNTIINPSEASIKNLKWSSSNASVVTTSEDGVITSSSQEGEVIITATTCDGTNISASIKIIVQEGAGIADVFANDKLDIRVKNGKLHIRGKAEADIVSIYNVQGQLILSTNDNEIELNTKGIYIIKVGSVTKKLTI